MSELRQIPIPRDRTRPRLLKLQRRRLEPDTGCARWWSRSQVQALREQHGTHGISGQQSRLGHSPLLHLQVHVHHVTRDLGSGIVSKEPTQPSASDPHSVLAPKIYDDALSPAAKVVGQSLESVVRTALRPIDGLVWSLDKAFDWVARKVTDHFETRQTPLEDVVPPTIEMAGRILLGLQIAGPADDPLPRNLFAKLPARLFEECAGQRT